MIFLYPVLSYVLTELDFYFLVDVADLGWSAAVERYHRRDYYSRLGAADWKQLTERNIGDEAWT